jgi:tRNA uridine 5-carbamoylmethylation protein Kti12
MSFKENLLKKINIDKMGRQVIASIGPVDSGRKIDKKIMQKLLELADYTYKRKRDLDLYIEDIKAEKTRILVLDNDLAIYDTSVYDVAMRKSPTVKEMMNPFNVVKILKDTDVVISKKEDSVKTIQQECIAKLNLSFNASDFDDIVKDGLASLENGYSDGVIECLDLFSEILHYKNAPKAFRVGHHKITGVLIKKESGEEMFGPMVLYSMIHNTLKLIDQQIGSFDREKIEFVQHVAAGKKKASTEGSDVFQYLKEAGVDLLALEIDEK